MKKLLLLLALLFAPALSDALTVSDIRSQVRLRIKDLDSTRQRYTDAQLLGIFNEGQRDVIGATLALGTQRSFLSIPAGTTMYQLTGADEEIIQVYRVVFNDANLNELDIKQIDSDNNNASFFGTVGTPTAFYVRKDLPGYVGLYPTPNFGTGTLRVSYHKYPDDLTGDSSVPYDGAVNLYTYHNLLIYHACMTIFAVEGDFNKSAFYKTLYDAGLQVMNENLGERRINFKVPKETK